MAKKYFFGYYGLNGNVTHMKWMEENGSPIGGAVKILGSNRHEITKREFDHRKLQRLSVKHPYKDIPGLQ